MQEEKKRCAHAVDVPFLHIYLGWAGTGTHWLQTESIDPAHREGGETELFLFLCPPTLSPTSHTIKRNVSLCPFH